MTYVQRGVQLLCSVVGETLSGGKNGALGNSLKDFANREPPKVPSARKAVRKEGGDVGDADGGAGDLSIDRHHLFGDDEFDGIDDGSEDRDSDCMRGVDEDDDDDDIRFAAGESGYNVAGDTVEDRLKAIQRLADGLKSYSSRGSPARGSPMRSRGSPSSKLSTPRSRRRSAVERAASFPGDGIVME